MSDSPAVVRGPQGGLGARALLSPVGRLATGWWIDRPALAAMIRVYFPLSRMWAAAELAGRDVDRFVEESGVRVPGWLRGRVARALVRIADCREAARAATAARDAAFWDDAASPHQLLWRRERARQAACDRAMNSRLALWPLRAFARLRPVRIEVHGPEAVFAEVAAGLDDRARWFAPDPAAAIERSHELIGQGRRDYWLRLRSPAPHMGDLFTVHVREPLDVADPPTVIYGSGVGIEPDLGCDPMGDFSALVARGMRVIELQAPWHGARRPAGYWSGEPFFATAPLGPIRFFQAQARETAALIQWARQTSRGPVALAGISLGALAAQLVADVARDWPVEFRPDAMFLLTAADRMDLLTFDSALARGLGLDRALTRAGWTPELLERLRPLTDPMRPPVMGPDKVIMVLGTRDSVTPYALGAAMAKVWGLPPENLFVGRRGHFSTPINVLRDQRPFDRLAEVLG
ncbi:MAG: alpha/beta hydrolase family protein [Alphaproteobacteria bacterium]